MIVIYYHKNFFLSLTSILTHRDADFDYGKNRSVQHYFVTLDDGMEFDATTIKELKEIAKRIESKSK